MKKNLNIKYAASALSILCCTVIPNAYATLASNAILNFDDGVTSCALGADAAQPTGCAYNVTATSGSYFGMDTSGDGIIQEGEKTALTSAGTGLTIGTAQAMGEIDNTWSFAGNLGNHYTQQGLVLESASGNTASLDMTGWIINWNGEGINLYKRKDSATITCAVDCSVGDSFTLDHTEIIGAYDDTLYELHLEGVIPSAVPVPAAVWLFASGLVGLFGFSRRQK